MKKVIPLIIGVVMAIVGGKMALKNLDATGSVNIEFYKELCLNGEKATAFLQNEYKENEGLSIVIFKYDYYVGGVQYTEEVSTSKLPESTEFEITYLPKNPSQNSMFNVCKVYENAQNDTSSLPLFYVGLAMLIIGLITAWTSLKMLVSR